MQYAFLRGLDSRVDKVFDFHSLGPKFESELKLINYLVTIHLFKYLISMYSMYSYVFKCVYSNVILSIIAYNATTLNNASNENTVTMKFMIEVTEPCVIHNDVELKKIQIKTSTIVNKTTCHKCVMCNKQCVITM